MNCGLEEISDRQLFEECFRRLQRQFKKNHGHEMAFGKFEWITHQSVFQGIEERPRNKIYWSPSRLGKEYAK